MLTTDQPQLYERFGFRVVPEHRSTGLATAQKTGRRKPMRLDLTQEGDLPLLHHLLEHRAPVSNLCGVGPEKPLFLFNCCRAPLYYVEGLDLVLHMEIENRTLKLYDVVATQMPTMDRILEHVPALDRLEVYFTPDRLEADLDPEPHQLDGDDCLMVRGSRRIEVAPGEELGERLVRNGVVG